MSFEWIDTTLGDFLNLKRGYDLPKTKRKDGDIPIISSSGYSGFHDISMAKGPGVVTGRYGTIGEVFYIPEDFWPLNTTLYVEHFKGNSPLFSYYLLQTIDFHAYSDKAAVPGINRNHVHMANIRVPNSIIAQERIASFLKKFEDKITSNKKINQTLEQMAQALFKSWFVDFEPVKAKMAVLEAGGSQEDATLAAMTAISGKNANALAVFERERPEHYAELKATAELFPSAMQESELGEIPDGWETPAVQDVANTIKGKSYKSSELDRSKTALVTLKSFSRGGGYRLDGLKEYTGKYKPDQEVFAGDLIIAYTDVTQAADVIGKPAMVISDTRYEHLVISLDVAVVRPFNDSLKYYLYGVARTEQFQKHTSSHSTGTTVLHLSKNAVPGYRFILANEGLVNIYAQYAKSIFSKVNTTIEENNCLSELRDTLLPKLLSGEITLPEAEQAVSEAENV
ncbi:restriction endonuclease subunit S [Cronobacter malonaticus]|nr:restriction endonuclease subunit S [Cronobacter malonaticus]